MKMTFLTPIRIFGSILTVFLLLLCSLLIASCEEYVPGGEGNYQRFDWDLQGTWRSADSSVCSGILIIDYNRITILGYEESQTVLLGGDDAKRPFRNFTKDVALEGYSEENTFLIKSAGTWQAIPYTYWSEGLYPKVEFLRFTFGGRDEILKKQN